MASYVENNDFRRKKDAKINICNFLYLKLRNLNLRSFRYIIVLVISKSYFADSVELVKIKPF